jgi:hypothetical protein
MSYEIFGSNGKYWTCHQYDWGGYLDVAIAFCWLPEGAFFKCDEGGFGEHPSGSYIGNDFQIVTDDDARAMAAALKLAVDTINAGSPMTDNQATALKALKALETDTSDLLMDFQWTEEQRAHLLRIRNESLAAHPDEVRTIRTCNGTFDLNIRGMMDLADVVSAGKFTIA